MKYACVSGGADSTAMALHMWQVGYDFELLFSDTGAELPETYWLLPKLSEYIGKKLNVVSNASFFQKLVHWGYLLPSFKRRWCTSDLKIASQEYFFDLHNIDRKDVCVGITADEKHRARDKQYPLIDMKYTKEKAKQLCVEHGLLNPVYEWRSSVSCFCCPMQKKKDWKGLLRHHPTLYAVSQEWERQSIKISGFKWNQSWSLEEFKKATDKQVEMWPEPDAEPC